VHRTGCTHSCDIHSAATDEETWRLRGEWLDAERRLDDAMPTDSALGATSELREGSMRGRRVARRLADAGAESTLYLAAVGASASVIRPEPAHAGWQGRGRRAE
jgi:hypothetical protein